MALPRVSPPAYRRATFAALALLTIIVVTGAAVRLTDSGLGCTDWPRCNEHKLVSASSYNEAIEQGNRLFTGLVTIGVAAAVLGSLRRQPRRADLVWLSWGLVGGVVGQIVLGGITVLFDLHPALVACHFLLSIVLVTDAVVLHHRAGLPDDFRRVRPARGERTRQKSVVNGLLAVALAVLMAGTVVTGTGPHGGDPEAPRFQFVMTDVVRVHSVLVWILVALTLFLALRTRHRAVVILLAVLVAQGVVGYTQYFMGVPPLLVAVHVIGALAVWIAALRVKLELG